MKELTKRKKIIGTIETVLAAAVIIIAVVTAPKLSAQKEEETSAAASETAAATQAVTETEPEKTEPTTSSVGIGVQPIYSRYGRRRNGDVFHSEHKAQGICRLRK